MPSRLRRCRSFASLSAKADAARDAGRLDEAAALYRQALAKRPAWQEGWWSLGTILYDQDSYASAARAFRRLLSTDPKNGTAHLMLGSLRVPARSRRECPGHIRACEGARGQERRATRAGPAVSRSDALVPQRPLRGRDRGRETAGGAGRRERRAGWGAWTGVLLIRPKEALEGATTRTIRLCYARVGRAQSTGRSSGTPRKRRTGTWCRSSRRFPTSTTRSGDFCWPSDTPDPAIEQFKEEIANNPRHVRARMQIAAACYRVDSPPGIPFAQEVVKLEPDYPFGHYLLGLLYLDARDLDRRHSGARNCGSHGADRTAVSVFARQRLRESRTPERRRPGPRRLCQAWRHPSARIGRGE